ncbi:MAG TPA: hypothetical protein VGQ52_21920 [Gemmatimonadaceae bacterium]|jgi:hypothetical protein|nr:hypothetical protein [Gemmatimonadaceae bacterium]
MESEKALIQQISKRYGPVINLETNPGTMIEIIRLIRSMYVAEPGTPGPGTIGGSVTNEDIMKAILKLGRDMRAAAPRSPTAKRGRATPKRSK